MPVQLIEHVWQQSTGTGIVGVGPQRFDLLGDRADQLVQWPGTLHGRNIELVGLEGFTECRYGHVRIGLLAIGTEMRPAHQVGLRDLERSSYSADIGATIRSA